MNYKRFFQVVLIVSAAMLLSSCARTSNTTSSGFSIKQYVGVGYIELDIFFNDNLDGVVFCYDTNLGQPYIKTTSGLVDIKRGNEFIIAFEESRNGVSLKIDTERAGYFTINNVYGYKWSGDIYVDSCFLGSKTVYISQGPPNPEPENPNNPPQKPNPPSNPPEPPQAPVKGTDDIQQIRNLIESGGYDARYDYNNDGMVDIKDLIICLKKGLMINNPPNTPVLINPGNNEKGVPTSVELMWSCSDPDGDYLTYDIYFGYYNPPPLLISNWSNDYYYISDLEPGTKYYWKIVAKDGKGGINESSVWSFITGIVGENVILVDEDFEDYYPGYEPRDLEWGFCLKSGNTVIRVVQSGLNGLCLEMEDNDQYGDTIVGAEYDIAYFNEGIFHIYMMIPSYSPDNWEVIRFYNTANDYFFDVGIGPTPEGPYLFYSTIENGEYVYCGIEKAIVGKWYEIEIGIVGNYYEVYIDNVYAGTGYFQASEIDAFCIFTPWDYGGHCIIDDIHFEAVVSREKKISRASRSSSKEFNLNLPTTVIIMK